MPSLHGKDKIFSPCYHSHVHNNHFLYIEITISPDAFEPFYRQWVPHGSRADRPVTAPARVQRPAVFVHTQMGPALPAPGCWKGISWEPSTFWEAALFTWTWSLGVKERVKNNKLQSWSECVNLRFKRSPFFRVLVFLFSQYSSWTLLSP